MEKNHTDAVSEEEETLFDNDENHEEKRTKVQILWRYILGAFLISLMFIFLIPYYSINLDPNPRAVHKIDFNLSNVPGNLDSIDEIRYLNVTPAIRNAAIEITSSACTENTVCYAKALFYYVRGNIYYLPDPANEYIQSPEETLLGAGDCEDQAILLFALMQAIGISGRIVLIPDHAYLQIFIPDARAKYRDKDGWINLDPTCTSCDFGEVAPFNADKVVRYV